MTSPERSRPGCRRRQLGQRAAEGACRRRPRRPPVRRGSSGAGSARRARPFPSSALGRSAATSRSARVPGGASRVVAADASSALSAARIVDRVRCGSGPTSSAHVHVDAVRRDVDEDRVRLPRAVQHVRRPSGMSCASSRSHRAAADEQVQVGASASGIMRRRGVDPKVPRSTATSRLARRTRRRVNLAQPPWCLRPELAAARHCCTSRPSCQTAKLTSGRAKAWRRTASICANRSPGLQGT